MKYDDLLNPEDVEKYRQNQFLQNQTNTGVTGLASPINQNKPIGQMVNAKVQQVFSQPTNLVNKNTNLLQGFGDNISNGLKSISNKNEDPNIGKTQAQSLSPKKVVYPNNLDFLSKKILNQPQATPTHEFKVLNNPFNKANVVEKMM